MAEASTAASLRCAACLAVALVLGVKDLAAAKAVTAKTGAVAADNRVTVPPSAANGVMLVLEG